MDAQSKPGATTVASPSKTNESTGRTIGIVTVLVVALAAAGWWLLLRGGGDQAAIEQVIRDVAAAENAGDGERFVTFFTDDGLAAYDVGTREAILTGEAELGEDQIEVDSFPEVRVEGDTASATVYAAIQPVLYEVAFELVRQDGDWLIDNFEFRGGAPALAGTDMVDVTLDEFSFRFDAAAMSSGEFGIAYENVGEQSHEMLLIRVTEDGLTLDGLLDRATNSDEEDPEGMEHVGFLGFTEPGDQGTVRFTEPLAPGRYAFLCFFPDTSDPEETPHAFKGMAAEFTVE